MIEKLIKKIAFRLDKEKVPYMIIGGQAVLLYGSPRLTRDIDITLGIDTDRLFLIEKLCRKLNLKFLVSDKEKFAKETKVLPAEETKLKIRIDFIFSFTLYERQAIKRAKRVLVEGYPVKFVSCEDLIIHKMLAGRAVDEEDIKNILIKQKKKMDLKYIKKWLSELASAFGQREILNRFKVLTRDI